MSEALKPIKAWAVLGKRGLEPYGRLPWLWATLNAAEAKAEHLNKFDNTNAHTVVPVAITAWNTREGE